MAHVAAVARLAQLFVHQAVDTEGPVRDAVLKAVVAPGAPGAPPQGRACGVSAGGPAECPRGPTRGRRAHAGRCEPGAPRRAVLREALSPADRELGLLPNDVEAAGCRKSRRSFPLVAQVCEVRP